MTNLKQLYLIRNQIVDLEPLSSLTNLTKLNLSLNQIADVQPLSQLTNLTELILNFNRISSIKPLSQLTNLKQLFLEANQISDATPLSGLTNLTGLSLATNKIEDLSSLSKLNNLEFLYLGQNQIKNVQPLSGLSNLILLFLESNQIADVTPLAGLTNLTTLNVSKNRVADVTALSALTKLTNFDLTGNPIPAVEAEKLIQKNKELLKQKTDNADKLMQEASQLFDRETATAYREALQKIEAARSIYQQLGNVEEEANALNRMGFIAKRSGEIQQALDYYNRALLQIQNLADRPKEAVILNNIGALYYALGEQQQAINYYDRALAALRKTPDIIVEATALNNTGLAYNQLGEKQQAREYFDRALPLFRAAGDRAKEATALNNIGLVYNDLGNQKQALEYYDRALQLRQEMGDRREAALTINNIGVAHSELGEQQKAREYFNQSLPIFREVGDSSSEALTLYHTAVVTGKLGNLSESLNNIKSAIKIVENLRTKIASDELRISYFATVQDYYKFYIDLLMQLHKTNPKSGYDRQAFEISERSRARSLLELLQEANADIRQGIAPELLQQERDLQQQLDTLETKRIEILNRQNPPAQQIAELEKQRQNLLSQYQNIQSQIRATSPRYADLTQPQPLNLSQIQQQILDENTILLQYALGEDRSYLWAVTKTSITSYELPPNADIETAARNFRNAVTNPIHRNIPNRVAKASNALSQIILQPAASKLDRQRLLIVGDGILNYLPFAALSLPETSGENRNLPLISKYEIAFLPSASTLGILRQNYNDRQPPTRTLVVLADPVFSADDERVTTTVAKVDRAAIESLNLGLSRSSRDNSVEWKRLKFTSQEADSIVRSLVDRNSGSQHLDFTKSVDFSANRNAATSQNLSQYKIIHFATHGLANSTNPELSGIIMSLVDENGKPVNGFLRLTDIFNLKLAAELVVLSACQTGLGQNIQGEGILGLTRGFMYAGAKRVVVSLWNVDDEGTAEFMAKFYQEMLQKKLTPAAALRAAQLAMLQQEKWQLPYYWAAFTIQGEWQ
ncbi:MAG: CHAT domain-containing protein [Oscillatoriales cyanobacterium RU_3_3]|nr:CHAT domain-containing protein [Oscillatoriales cyanobacterium RU_3_3]